MIKRGKFKNLQIHKDLEIEFTEGVNSIVGESGQGKSAIIRGMYMLIYNSPRGADKLFRNNSKKPTIVTLEDDDGNIITKHGKDYIIGEDEPLKAVGSSIPEEVQRVFPLDDINWQRQFDGPYLINKHISAGATAKILHKNMGMEDQEKIIKAINKRLTEEKNEIKRLLTNEQENKSIVDKFKDIKSLKRALLYLKEQQVLIDDTEETIDEMQSLLKRIKDIKRTLQSFEKIDSVINEGKAILKKYKTLPEKQKEIEKLKQILKSLNTKKKIIPKIDTYVTEVKKIIKQREKIEEVNKNINNLIAVLNRQEAISDCLETLDEHIEKTKKQLQQIKVCPLCKQKIK